MQPSFGGEVGRAAAVARCTKLQRRRLARARAAGATSFDKPQRRDDGGATRITKWHQLQSPRERLRWIALRSGGRYSGRDEPSSGLGCSRRYEYMATAAQNRPQRIRRSAHKGAIWAAIIASACPQAAWGRGRRGAMVVSVGRGLWPQREGVILGIN